MPVIRIAIVLLLIVASMWAGRDFLLGNIFGEEYKDAMFQCDHAMREHFIAKSRVEISPKPESIRSLQAAELGLLNCHDYDKMRKSLLRLGISEEALQLLGLEALEEKEFELAKFVEIHEFSY